MYKFRSHLIIIILSLLFTFCKDNNKYTDREIQILRQSLSFMVDENNRMTNIIELKYNGNAGAEPYFHLSNRLNNYINSIIDTSFKYIESDTIKIQTRLTDINKKYRQLIDSVSSQYKFQLYLPSDDSLLRQPFCNYPGYFPDDVLNHYLLTQRILHRHLNVLTILRSCIGEINVRFFMIEKAGYAVNSIQNDAEIKVKLHYNFPKWYADYRLIKFENIIDENKASVKIKDLQILTGDTVELKMLQATTGSYTATAKYSVLAPDGNKYERTIEFPFTTR